MTGHIMIKRAALLATVLVGVGCAQAPKEMYLWQTFPRQQYDALLREGVSPEAQMQAMEVQVDKARGTGAALPPGFRAHLGLLHLSVGNVAAARQMWLAEKTAFPESAQYMDRLLKRLDAPSKTASKENPA